MEKVAALILAAGQGKRMKSGLLKVLHPIAGRPMVGYILEATRTAGISRMVVVIGHQAEKVQEVLGSEVEYVRQKEQLGTGHAVLAAEGVIQEDLVLVLYGDTPLLDAATLRAILQRHQESGAAATVVTTELADPTGYGRILRNQRGGIEGIVEEKNAGEAERQIREVNTGIVCYRRLPLFQALGKVKRDEFSGEYYLTDVVPLLLQAGYKVETFLVQDQSLVLGINTRVELARVEKIVRQRHLERLMLDGVTVVDPASTFVDSQVEVGMDTTLYPFTFLEGNTRIGAGCRIGPAARIVDSVLGNEVVIEQSTIEKSHLSDGVHVGPFSHLRADCFLEKGVKVGNFAEIKNTLVRSGTKIPHHSYLGDSTIGSRVNVGAGTVIVNYDGQSKHHSEIGEGAFIGCNSNLISPVRIGDGSYVAAGSTITEDVPEGALAIARGRQVNKEGWVARSRHRAPEK
ncbi:MAG: bifunctional UDP-N-acetylglucosamine diphosphorylase/glucosamine-1-phosphate N-acetyltransferase GlmU [Firmicutes bacterium]|nr:bifunctional UDP-N-acetylglucosamine diphosphorylase/glucosamine-1-phosphate N-acetyltransferase GlmU [Bacillota bacterium]MCL5040203.1 bifunctional UDP-N-acetylglucosamine diphosphorylase/glucosamine-1-phosphate N-acetyltransferase GlmU [Bacillota bacterium]